VSRPEENVNSLRLMLNGLVLIAFSVACAYRSPRFIRNADCIRYQRWPLQRVPPDAVVPSRVSRKLKEMLDHRHGHGLVDVATHPRLSQSSRERIEG
jgi:hypothetical protein